MIIFLRFSSGTASIDPFGASIAAKNQNVTVNLKIYILLITKMALSCSVIREGGFFLPKIAPILN